MSTLPLAYHITFGTYGSRLHGGTGDTVDKSRNQPGDPVVGRNADWERLELSQMRFDPVFLDDAQRLFVEAAMPGVAERGGWRLHTFAARPDHVHVLLSSPNDGKTIRRLLKRWLGEAMAERWALPGDGATWWASGGSVRWVWDQAYFDTARGYILKQRTTPL